MEPLSSGWRRGAGRLTILAAFLSPLMFTPSRARADDIGSTIEQASKSYQGGKKAATRALLQEALQLLSLRTAQQLDTALPAPLAGWQQMDRQARSLDNVTLGGGSRIVRRYRNAQNQVVEIAVTADSGVLPQLSMVMSSTTPAETVGKSIRIGGQSAFLTSNGEIQMLYDDRFLIAVTGSASGDDKIAYAQAIDWKKLAE